MSYENGPALSNRAAAGLAVAGAVGTASVLFLASPHVNEEKPRSDGPPIEISPGTTVMTQDGEGCGETEVGTEVTDYKEVLQGGDLTAFGVEIGELVLKEPNDCPGPLGYIDPSDVGAE